MFSILIKLYTQIRTVFPSCLLRTVTILACLLSPYCFWVRSLVRGCGDDLSAPFLAEAAECPPDLELWCWGPFEGSQFSSWSSSASTCHSSCRLCLSLGPLLFTLVLDSVKLAVEGSSYADLVFQDLVNLGLGLAQLYLHHVKQSTSLHSREWECSLHIWWGKDFEPGGGSHFEWLYFADDKAESTWMTDNSVFHNRSLVGSLLTATSLNHTSCAQYKPRPE